MHGFQHLASMQQASHEYCIRRSLITVELRFTAGLAANTEVFFPGEILTFIYINSQKVSKNCPNATGIGPESD